MSSFLRQCLTKTMQLNMIKFDKKCTSNSLWHSIPEVDNVSGPCDLCKYLKWQMNIHSSIFTVFSFFFFYKLTLHCNRLCCLWSWSKPPLHHIFRDTKKTASRFLGNAITLLGSFREIKSKVNDWSAGVIGAMARIPQETVDCKTWKTPVLFRPQHNLQLSQLCISGAGQGPSIEEQRSVTPRHSLFPFSFIRQAGRENHKLFLPQK